MLTTWLIAGVMACGQADAADKEKPSDKAAAAESADADLKARVRKLVRELDARQKARRDEAEQQLMELGPAALDLLPETTARTPAEVALRLDRIRSQFERARAENSVKASTVTLSGKALPLSKVLAEITKQTENKIYDLREEFGQETTDPEIDVDFDKTPFWAALDKVLDLANLNIYPYASEPGVAIVNRSESRVPRHGTAVYAGSFRFEGAEFVARRDLRDPDSHSLELLISAAWEPRLQPILIMRLADGMQAVDEQGDAIEVAAAGAELEFPVDADMRSIDMPVQFTAPQRSVNRIASLKGKLSVLLPGKQETFRFTNLEKANRVEKRRAAVTVVLDEVRKNNALWEFRVRVVFDKAGGALESHRDWVWNNPAFLETPGNKEPLHYAGMDQTRQTENEIGAAYYFDVPEGLKDCTFIYQTPTAIMSMPLDYELKDLELP
ncbi:MAG TPA: hypothetical protein VHC19_29905 [Pirellulales bacterium]|nr:hypothetical protein [Pirellulales bacterium]